jgi:hypothetical protein
MEGFIMKWMLLWTRRESEEQTKKEERGAVFMNGQLLTIEPNFLRSGFQVLTSVTEYGTSL